MPSAPAWMPRHTALRAPPPAVIAERTGTPRLARTPADSRWAKATPSMTARTRCPVVWAMDSPVNAPRASGSYSGVRIPAR